MIFNSNKNYKFYLHKKKELSTDLLKVAFYDWVGKVLFNFQVNNILNTGYLITCSY